MALTKSTSTWDGIVAKQSRQNDINSSRLIEYLITVTYGAGDNYVTNGNAISLKEKGLKTYLFVEEVTNDKRLYLRYDTANEKIIAYAPDGADAGIHLPKELANASALVNSMVATFRVLGY